MYRPMLFNTEMVRAILEGRKTETRRRVRAEQAAAVLSSPARAENPDVPDHQFIEVLCDAPCLAGDVLWVRETWCEAMGRAGKYFYRAYAGPRDEMKEYAHSFNRWRPSIHMPREAARLFLRVTEVRAERLQEITPEGIREEGAQGRHFRAPTRGAFADLWNSTIQPKDRPTYGWEANPWVWVIRFERVDKPGDF